MQSRGGMMKVRSISHVGVTVTNFERAVAWYNKYFGFKLISEQILDKEVVSSLWPLYQVEDTTVRLGFLRAPKGQVVEIFEFSNQKEGRHHEWNKPGLSHFTLDVKNISRWYEEYKNDLDFVIEPQVTDGNHWVFLKDPDGNLIELIDLKMNYFIIRVLGGIAGSVMKRKKFKQYYEETTR